MTTRLLLLKSHLCKLSLEGGCERFATLPQYWAAKASFNVKDSLICRRCCWWGLLRLSQGKSQTINTFASQYHPSPRGGGGQYWLKNKQYWLKTYVGLVWMWKQPKSLDRVYFYPLQALLLLCGTIFFLHSMQCCAVELCKLKKY